MKKLVSAAVLTGTLLLSGGVASAQYGPGQPPTTVPEVSPTTLVRTTTPRVESGGLARTGDETMPMVAAGAALVAVGGAFVVAARRRSVPDAS